MFELGRDEEKLHYEVGKYMAGKNVDVLLTAGKLAKNIAAGAKDTGAVGEIHSFEMRDELIDALPQLLKKGDNILVKASHGMQFTEVVKTLEKY
jgi:UDP-N-acetylmuramoyl-tripeptide--D-alanyl-D-alanine ligase